MRASDPSRRAHTENDRFLDALVFLRRLYQRRGPRDSAPLVPMSRLLPPVGVTPMRRVAQ